MRSFALGELGWSLDRYRGASLYEYNEAVMGYWRGVERTAWNTREIIWTLIQGNPNIPKENKPQRKTDIMKLSIDKEAAPKKPPKVTKKDIEDLHRVQFNMK
jgi:hypothetical protein